MNPFHACPGLPAALILSVALLLPGAARAAVTTGPALRAADMNWVNTTLAGMTLDEKIGQMIMPSYSSGTADGNVSTYKVGGFIFLGNSNTRSGIVTATNHLQSISARPLLFSIDCEPGLGGRVTDATRFPYNMACAATRNLALARRQGGVTARECRAVGVQIGFGPVLDVNTEPVNPIIGVRAYSDQASLVEPMAEAYVAGANAEGLLVTYKHFPGHGDTTGDSHSSLPVIDVSVSKLMSRHVRPYETLLGRGTGDLVMTAHVWYTALDPGPTAWPATLSTNALTGILRNQLGYNGTIISDAFDMAGVQQAATTYDGVRYGVQAGLDIILIPPSVSQAFNGLKDAVTGGQISEARINDSVRRILVLKSRVGMPESTQVSPTEAATVVGHADNLAAARDIGQRAICAARVRPADVPLLPGHKILVFNLTAPSQIFYRYPASHFNNALASGYPNVTFVTVATSLSSAQIDSYVNQARTGGWDRVVVTSHEWKPTIPVSQQTLVGRLKSEPGVRMIYCSFGSPYQAQLWPGLENFYCAFSSHYDSQTEMASVLKGTSWARGQWPVTIPDVTPGISAGVENGAAWLAVP